MPSLALQASIGHFAAGWHWLCQCLFDGYRTIRSSQAYVQEHWQSQWHTCAVERRGVNQVAIFGYSQGGGATEVLARQLATNPPSGEYELCYTAYVDAVDHDGSNEENERPQGTAFHLNIYQENGIDELGGGPINGLQPQDEQINVTRDEGWDHSLDHYTIDNDEQVLGRVRQRFEHHVDR